MIYKKLPSLLLFLFAFTIIAIGGYQCATKTTDRLTIPNTPPPNTPPPNTSIGDNENLPPEPDDGCNRSKYRSIAENYNLGEVATFKFNRSSVEDYNLGQSQNFGLECARLYLRMDEIELDGRTRYKGQLSISYQEGNDTLVDIYESGFSKEENKYNHWTRGSWRPRRDKVNKEFYAIFENTDRAIILKVEDVRVFDVTDGEESYRASGEVYYKMFRWSRSAGKNDECHNNGTYMKYARSQPPRNRYGTQCWLRPVGPFSCLPHGALPVSDGKVPSVPTIDITGDLPCYNLLGNFFNLEIEEAFDVRSATDLD